MKSRTNIKRFLVDWAAVLALMVCFVAFTAYKGNSFMSTSNMVNILRAMAINTVFGIAATITMAPDGFDMSAGTLASCSAYVFVSAYLWLGQSLGMSILICILATLVMYQLTMFLILVCKIPDMLATCALMFVHQGIGQWYIGGGAVSTGMKTSWGAAPARTALSESFSAIGRAPWIAFLQTSGIGGDIYEFFHKWLGGINGGLAMATVATTAVIAAMSGVAATATIMMGLIALPAMLDRGYDKALATGPVLAGGCLGPIIPPSTIMIIMSSYTGVSAGWLFAGGALPGVGLALLFIIYIGIRCAINPKLGPGIPKAERPSWGEKMRVFKKVIAPIAIIVLVLGCIYAGIATPTEAAGVGAFASMVYALITRKLNVKNLRASLIQTMEVSAMLMWILMGGAAYNSLVNITRLSDVVAAAFASSNLDGLPLMLLIFALFFVMGMFLDTTPIIMIAIPILLPVIQASSLDTNATILILCVTLCLGMITPPFGINMFYLQGVAPPGVDTKVMYKAVMPYVIIFLVACFFMMLFPELIVIFPNAAMGY